jgi:hypothetical protein
MVPDFVDGSCVEYGAQSVVPPTIFDTRFATLEITDGNRRIALARPFLTSAPESR